MPFQWRQRPAVSNEVDYDSLAYIRKYFVLQKECFLPIMELAAQSRSTNIDTPRLPALLKNVHYIIHIFGLDSALLMHFLCKMHFNQQMNI